MTNVIKLQAPFERIKFSNDLPDAALYKSIILQAIIDATSLAQDCKSKKNKREAIEWIFSKNEFFVHYCEESGIEPDYIIKVTKNAMKHVVTKNTIKITDKDPKARINKNPDINNFVENEKKDWNSDQRFAI